MRALAKGSFQVVITPEAESGATDGNSNLGRMSLAKTYDGDLVAVGQGEMLTAITQTRGSAAYVAIERVTGALHGRSGSFVLHHTGVMNRAAQSLSIPVVPDSGTGDLSGISGACRIIIVEGKHFYELEYSLAQ